MPAPRQQQQTGLPGTPPDLRLIQMREWAGMNTKDARPAIADNEASWQENLIPFGNGGLRATGDVGTALYTAAGGRTISCFFPFNIGATAYHAVFLDNGTAVQVRISDGATTNISSTPGTFIGSSWPGCSQWGSQYLLIVGNASANGYWIWDGAHLFGAGTLAPTITVTAGGSGYSSAPTVSASGGSGSGATFTATVSAGAVVSIKVNNPGSGYVAGDTITIGFSGGGGSGATATGYIMPFGLSGTAIEVFNSHVWIFNNATGVLSEPGVVDNFATAGGGGAFSSTDSLLKVAYTAARQANGYLYPYGDSSVSVISNVQTSGSPASTTFNLNNTEPQHGTPWRDSVQAFGRALFYANPTGIYAMYGGTAEKISEKFDGVFASASLPLTGLVLPSAAVSTIYSLTVYLLLLTITDPFTGQTRPAMLAWDGRHAFMLSQSKTLTYIATQTTYSQPQAWGTDGTSLYKLFAQASTGLTKKLQTKLYDVGNFMENKQALWFGSHIVDNSGGGYTITDEFDTENTSSILTLQGGTPFTWVNNSGQTFTWQNNSAQAFTWGTAGVGLVNMGIMSVAGRLIGLVETSTSLDFTIVAYGIGIRGIAVVPG